MSDLRFDGRVAIITGAGGGLGRSHALELARRGAKVLVNDPGASVDGSGGSSRAADDVVAEIVAFGGFAVANYVPVGTPEAAQAIAEAALEAFGRIDILVNNAGILRDKAFHKMTPEMIDVVLDVHLRGALHLSQAVFTVMREQGYGRIVNTTSASGLYGNFSQVNYGAAKAGLAGLTRVLAIEGNGHDINVNAIAPIAATRMTAGMVDVDELNSTESVSAMVAWLAHEDCTRTGKIYSASGGRYAQIFFAETRGVVLDDPTVEAVRDAMSDIEDREGHSEPTDLSHATAAYAAHRREAEDRKHVLVG